ncbi:hypothetical protein CBM2626_U40027 [Cupriavidus taiwanensis]|nr:hypothetical protein CBM2615_U30024 [Cupriavidus taiwanensis]SPA03889.1 hypothetical protein CBM2626_U40027 [Cupriavidus taiwanensis]SPA12906.1 hypothetical protein CBM2625_U60011 [Cupriavidus taiwanensis]SPA57677.1 hypothetical protein CBM2638_U20011 [Cupriavidus taiwanensis]SPD49058.1 protein of unknown function [Cupriavidus taiwanensis]
MTKRRPLNVIVVALANKMARMIWAVLAHDRPYQKDYISVEAGLSGKHHVEMSVFAG